MHPSFSFDYFGTTITARPQGAADIPPLSRVLSAHCVPIVNNDRIITVNIIGRGFDIPGGHVDAGEAAEEAVRRESYEEARIHVKDLQLIDVWHLTSDNEKLGLKEKPYLLLYVAEVSDIDEFSTRNNEANERRIISVDDFVEEYFGGKELAKYIVDRAFITKE